MDPLAVSNPWLATFYGLLESRLRALERSDGVESGDCRTGPITFQGEYTLRILVAHTDVL